MFLKKIISVILSVYLIFSALPIQAQNFYFLNPDNTLLKPTTPEENKAHKKELDSKSAAFLGPSVYKGLGYFDRLYIWQQRNPGKAKNNVFTGFGKDAFIDPAWQEYADAVKNYYNTPYRDYSPYEILQAMQSKSRKIGELLKNNPRYIREVKRAKVKENVGYAIEGVVIGLLTIATIYTLGATGGAEGALIASWFGAGTATATTSTMAVTASVSYSKVIAGIILGEIFIILGDEITVNLYEDLTNRLIKYKYINNNAHAQELIANIRTAIESGDIITNYGQQISKTKITQGSRWIDEVAKKESIIRLYGLSVIEAELQYSDDPTKYDLAMLDIINLFSFRTKVCYDENVFTKTVIKDGEKHYVCNQNTVDVGTGRLLQRTPELTKALNTIYKMDSENMPKKRPSYEGNPIGYIPPLSRTFQ